MKKMLSQRQYAVMGKGRTLVALALLFVLSGCTERPKVIVQVNDTPVERGGVVEVDAGSRLSVDWRVPSSPPHNITSLLMSLFPMDQYLFIEADELRLSSGQYPHATEGNCFLELTPTCFLNDYSLSFNPIETTTLTFYSQHHSKALPALNFSDQVEITIKVNRDVQLAGLSFSDPELQACIEETGSTFTNEITSLDCSDREITDLRGIEYLYALQSLNLSGNHITKLNGLRHLDQLNSLNLERNPLHCDETQVLLEQLGGSVELLADDLACSLPPLVVDFEFEPGCDEVYRMPWFSQQVRSSEVSYLACGLKYSEDLQYFKNLTYLKWHFDSENHILTDFRWLSDLTSLQLTGSLPDLSVLAQLASLESLVLDENDLHREDLEGLNALTQLRRLYLSYNSIQTLPDMSGMVGLETLYVRRSDLTSLNGELLPPNLLTLDASDNEIEYLQSFESLAQLQSLDLGSNHLETLSINNLPKLSYLNVQNNQLVSLDLDLFPALVEVQAQSNQIQELYLGDLDALEHLDLGSNALVDIEISDLPSLSWLQVDQNQLASLELFNLPKLSSLRVPQNQLQELVLSNLPSLQHIRAWGNQLETVALNDVPELEYVDLDRNNLSGIDLPLLPKLTDILLSENQITSLNNVTGLLGSPLLRKIDLENNDVREGLRTLYEVGYNSVEGTYNDLLVRLNGNDNLPCEDYLFLADRPNISLQDDIECAP